MAGRTFVVGDIHGEIVHLQHVLALLPSLDSADTLVFLGDYVNRGPHSREVISTLMSLPAATPSKVICLRGNHEDAWLRIAREGWDEFALPPAHGCLATLRSFVGATEENRDGLRPATNAELAQLSTGDFLPRNVLTWMDSLPFWYEDSHGIYLHAGLPRGPKGFLHPSEVSPPAMMAWVRTDDFSRNYDGKRIFFGHTPVTLLPPELSTYTPEDPTDIWESEHAFGLDTNCGSGGFLTAIALPDLTVYESRLATGSHV